MDETKKRRRGLISQKEEPKPLAIEHFEQDSQSFSGEIFRELNGSPLVRPEYETDGKTPTAKYMLCVASVVVGAADREIRKLEREKESSRFWTGSIIQPAPSELNDDSEGGGTTNKSEASWFLRYLTLRNLVTTAVAISAAAWAVFVWSASEKRADLEYWKSQYQIAKAAAAQAEESRSKDEQHYKFIEDHGDKQNKELQDSKVAEQKLKDDNDNLTKTVNDLKAKLATALNAAKTAANSAPPAVAK